MARMWKLIYLLRQDLIVLILSVRHKDTPGTVKSGVIIACIYLLFPVDIVPDSIPLLGIIDDLIIFPLAIEGLLRFVPAYVREESECKARSMLRYMPLILAIATLIIVSWVVLVIWGGYTIITWLFA